MQRITKGLSFNVTLSDEQIEQIASTTADKIDYTTRINDRSNTWYEREIEMLKRQVTKRDEIIVKKEILIERVRESNLRWKELAEKYQEKYGEID